MFAKAAGARIAVSLGSESGARDCVNTAPISSLIDVNTAVVPPSPGGVATRDDAVPGCWRRRGQFVDPIDFVAAHRLEPVVSGVYDGLGIPGDRQLTGGEHFGKQVIHVSK